MTTGYTYFNELYNNRENKIDLIHNCCQSLLTSPLRFTTFSYKHERTCLTILGSLTGHLFRLSLN